MRLFRRNRGTVFVTGATGFLGRHLLAVIDDDWQVVSPPHGALDITDRAAVAHEVESWEPSVVVHLAYRKDRRDVIVDGSRNVAMAAADAGARLVHLSTDVVFGGRDRPYTEADAPDPVSDYGRWKAEAEAEVTRLQPQSVLVRTSLLYGTDILSPAQEAVADGVWFTDELRCPVHATDVAQAIVALAQRPDVTGPLHVAGPDAVSRAELAVAFARQQRLDPALLRTGTLAASGLQRPATLVLDSSRAASLGITCRPLAEALSRT